MSQSNASLVRENAGATGLPVAQPLKPAVRQKGNPAGASSGAEADDSHAARHDYLPPLASFGDLVSEAPAWLISAVLHMLVLIILGLVLVTSRQPAGLQLVMQPTDDAGEDLEAGDLDIPLEFDEPVLDEAASQPQVLADVAETETVPVEAVPTLTTGATPTTEPIRMSLSGREAGMKSALLAAFGGTGATQDAVAAGLEWLARNQEKTGLWNLSGKYADGVNSNNPDAATGLALLAFQGAGYTPQSAPSDPHSRVVARGWYALLKRQDESGNFFRTGRNHGRLYTQAICTIALCELYGMTKDEQYRTPAQMAVDYCVSTQSAEGGWRYYSGEGGDLSVTGWFVMAMQSARMAGLDVPSETLTKISHFLDLVTRDGGSQYAYVPGQGKKLSMTAEGLLCRQYLGWKHDDPRLRKGAEYLIQHLPTWQSGRRNAYYWYYASQVCHHMEGKYWRTWNDRMKTLLPAKQEKSGRERGSWDPNGDVGNPQGGRLFVTCLSIYMLEVYYRHLPIYRMDMLSGQ